MENSVIKLASYIDHTLLKATCTHIEIEKICKEAVTYGFAAVCVPPPQVRVAVAAGGVKVATVIGYPLGYATMKAKLAEVEQAIADGADELDIVINLIALKEGRWPLLKEEITVLTRKAHAAHKLVKVIIESGVLTDEEIIRCCKLYARVGVDFLKTSTGYAEKGATIGAVQLMRQHLPEGIRIKASGGIRDAVFARQLIGAGAQRLGCSAGVQIVQEAGEGGEGHGAGRSRSKERGRGGSEGREQGAGSKEQGAGSKGKEQGAGGSEADGKADFY